jgi:sterol desaturase/sphingolipid hydroxylase (fatty acid hydroxylase superfamily)
MVRVILSWALWPIGVAAFLVSILYFSDLHNPQSIYSTSGRTFLVALLVLVGLEVVLPYREEWKIRGDRDVWRDISHFVLYTQVGGFIAQFVFLLLIASFLGRLHLPSLWPRSSSLLIQVLLVMVLGDALEYGLHRLAHAWPALWRVHAIHHMPTRLHMLKAGRHHVLYFLARGVIVWMPLLLIGTPPELIVWQIVTVLLTGNIDHANIDFRIPGFVHRLLVTPHFHRIHHAADPHQGNANFGVLLPVWDMLFGTHVDPMTTAEGPQMGIDGDPIPHRLLAELLLPFTRD